MKTTNTAKTRITATAASILPARALGNSLNLSGGSQKARTGKRASRSMDQADLACSIFIIPGKMDVNHITRAMSYTDDPGLIGDCI